MIDPKNDYSDTTVPVMSYKANGYGLYDMAGNVWEWCLDWYAAGYYKTLRDGERNPAGPSTGDIEEVKYYIGSKLKKERSACRVVRGGGLKNIL